MTREPIRLELEWLRYRDIAARAEELLERFGRAEELPVDVERIVEFDLKMDIFLMPGLQDIEGESFITSDLAEIYIDQYVYEHREARCRFSLAHEIGHAVLHRRVFEKLTFTTLAEWKEFHRRVTQEDYGRLEWQAYAFGGCLLVPPRLLKREFDVALADAAPEISGARAAGFERSDYLDYALESLANRLRPVFLASADVLKKRIEKDGLLELIK